MISRNYFGIFHFEIYFFFLPCRKLFKIDVMTASDVHDILNGVVVQCGLEEDL